MWYITLDDRGYRIAHYAAEPDNAIAGPYDSLARAQLKLDYMAQDGKRSAKVLVWMLAVFALVTLGWALRGML